MANPPFQATGGGAPQGPMMQQFPKFMQMMRGRDAQRMLDDLVSSGQVSQAQLNAVQQRYQQIGGIFNRFKGMFGF